MFSLWAKIFDDNDKIISNEVFNFKQEFDARYLYPYVVIIANKFKIETPIVLKKHINNLDGFNFVKFSPDDFVDKVTFKCLVIEILKQ
jgi:hypothetical protein